MQCKTLFVVFIYLIAINLFSVFIKLLEFSDYILQFNSNIDLDNIQFDYIIVGSGSAGAVIARRLAETKQTVLLFEAGSYGNKLLNIPSLGLLLQNSHLSWRYSTVSQNKSCFGLKQNISFWPTGKMVGGTGMLNNMMYVRGHLEDFNDWFKYREEYSYINDIKPYFNKLEETQLKDNCKFATNPYFTSALPTYLLPAAQTLGFPIHNSILNCEIGFSNPQINQCNGSRRTTSHYIINEKYSNIYLKTNREVTEVLFHENFEAYGVKYQYKGESYIAKAKKGVILSAGTIGTPKILLHSGIGPKWHLDNLGIQIKNALPVGENLQDHLTTGLDLILVNQTLGNGLNEMFSPLSPIEYFLNGRGPWTTGGCETLGYMNINDSNKDAKPDIQFMAMPLGLNEDRGMVLRHLFNIKDDVWDKYFALLNQNITITILPVLLHPRSKGSVRLQDKNFDSKLLIDPNYLSDYQDVETIIRGIQTIKQIIKTKSMQQIGAELNTNIFPGCENFKFDTKSYWECYVRHLTITSYHPIGTCKMGPESDETTVINFQFQVKGTNNLYVVDGSIVPELPSGNVNGPILMLAEMASDVFKFRDHLNQGKCSIKEMFLKRTFC